MDAPSPVGAYFPLKPGTKESAISAWQVVVPGTYPAAGSYGMALSASDLVLDGDPRNYPTGRNVLAEVIKEFGLLPTRAVKTPSGGFHIYLKKDPSVEIKKSQARFPGIDFLSRAADGSGATYVCGPGTTTEAGPGRAAGTYTLESDAPIKEAPAALLAILERRSTAQREGAPPSLLMAQQFKNDCMIIEPAVKGSRGITSYKVACNGRDLGLPSEIVYEHMRDQWCPRWELPFSDQELHTQVDRAYRYAKNALGSASVESKLAALPAPPLPVPGAVRSIAEFQHERVRTTVHQKSITLKKNGIDAENTQGNVVFLLRHDPAWQGRLRYNAFADRLEIKGRPDWRQDQLNKSEGLTKYDLAFMQAWFSSYAKMEVGVGNLEAGCFAAADPYHPVRDYLDGLEWDGKPRLDKLLVNTLGCEDNAYTRAVAACTLIAAVKRIYEPGSKLDYILVLEAKQGTRKSTWVAALGGDWASTGELVPRDKDTYQNLRGKWIVELPEIDSTFTKADFAWLKKTITTASDTYRPSYARTAETIPRESIFIATLNPGASGEYLRDDENRRYWPIKTGAINVERLTKDRDQYFAEAKARYLGGELTWVTDPEAHKIAQAEQKRRRETDPWTEILSAWVKTKTEPFGSTEVMLAMGFTAKDVNSRHRTRLYACLRELGYDYIRYQSGHCVWEKAVDWSTLK